MSTEKIVSLQVSEDDMNKLLTGKRKRRSTRRTESFLGGTGEPVPAPAPATSEIKSVPAPVESEVKQEQPIIPVSTPVTIPASAPASLPAPNPILNPAPQTGGDVKIIPKKTVTQLPKIMPTKKRHPIVAATIKKPKLLVVSKVEIPTTPLKKRRFTEKRISLHIKPLAKTRKERRLMKDKISKMPFAAVRKMLISKGLIKVKANPPEDIARNMLHDFMMLHTME